MDSTVFEKVKFEQDYIFRNHRNITSRPDIALTELVANAWDAGALNVEIILPKNENENVISITDDGCGMSEKEFSERWMTLNYNRENAQGKYAEFPEDILLKNKKRIAYGRNGVGRYGMFCFSNKYTVETWQNGIGYIYEICISSGNEPFTAVNTDKIQKLGHGTKISTVVDKNKIQNIEEIKNILSARFSYDPEFILKINNEKLDLFSNNEIIAEKTITTQDNIQLYIAVIHSPKTANNTKQHGVAFWVNGRLVGNPSWSYGTWQFLDGRLKVAKKYTIIVKSDSNDIVKYVRDDWTGFYDNYPVMENVYKEVNKVIKELIKNLMEKETEKLKEVIIDNNRDKMKILNISEQRDISKFMDIITKEDPIKAEEFLENAVRALMKIQQSKKGIELLGKLSNMSANELDKLNDILSQWEIDDILTVMNEIDHRITVIAAIERIYNDKKTDELHTLHPMILSARWFFGAEFDSNMFCSNNTLNTIIKKLFKDDDYDTSVIANLNKRPDIVCLKKSTMSSVCTDRKDDKTGLMKPDQILIIELKRGGFEIGADELSQAQYYVRQIKKSGSLHANASIHAFVVGASIGDIDTHHSIDSGIVDVVTYGHLVETAKIKLLGLQKKLQKHYDDIGDKSLVEKALSEKLI